MPLRSFSRHILWRSEVNALRRFLRLRAFKSATRHHWNASEQIHVC